MKLKGDWDSGTSYVVGDVVKFTDGLVYQAINAVPAGSTPHNTVFWSRMPQPLATCALMVMDGVDVANSDDVKLEDDLTQTTAGKKALDAHQGNVLKGMIPTNISNEAITLSTETGDYLITVDDSGETPELAITLIEEAGET